MEYDSAQDTRDHIDAVRRYIKHFTALMEIRAMYHDQSKLRSPEKEVFDKYTPMLKNLTYGTKEYFGNLLESLPLTFIRPASDESTKCK